MSVCQSLVESMETVSTFPATSLVIVTQGLPSLLGCARILMNVLMTRALAGRAPTFPGCLSAGAQLGMCLTETPTPAWILMSAALVMVAAARYASTIQALHSAGKILYALRVGLGMVE
jgi:hypothetical protein